MTDGTATDAGAPTGAPGEPTVLVVEDYTELLSLYTEWLADGYETLRARWPTEAIPRAVEADLVLLDRKLGGTEGEELVSELRAHGVDCPVALLGYREPGPELLDLPVDAYTEKPLRRDALRALVEELVERRDLDEATRERRAIAARVEAVEAAGSTRSLRDDPRYERALARLGRPEPSGRRRAADD